MNPYFPSPIGWGSFLRLLTFSHIQVAPICSWTKVSVAKKRYQAEKQRFLLKLRSSLQKLQGKAEENLRMWTDTVLAFIRPPLEKGMAPHSSTLTRKIPWMEEPGGLQSMGSLGVGHNWVTLLSLFTFIHWRRKWQPTPALLPGESQGQRSLVGCRLWGCTESDMTEVT